MSDSKPTPGPWAIEQRYTAYAIEPNVAWMGASSSHTAGENLANARLIAAAPEMLAALKLAEKFGEESAMRSIDPDAWDAINSAINKAE